MDAPLVRSLLLVAVMLGVAACASSPVAPGDAPAHSAAPDVTLDRGTAPTPDPRIGLGAGLFDAEEAVWNLRVLSATPPPEAFVGVTNSDLAFTGDYAIQGNYNGVIVWDLSNPAAPELVTEYVCPASQSDVSVYENLLFVSGEGLGGRLDCGTEGVDAVVSEARLRGIRIFDISDIRNPEYVGNVQTCRGSHTHSVLKDPNDDENVYVYVSGSAPVRPEEELPGCSSVSPEEDPNSALFRIEVIKVPLAHPEQAAIVSSPRIFDDLEAPPTHGLAPADIAEIEAAKARGEFVGHVFGRERVLWPRLVKPLLEEMVRQRGGTGEPTAADSAALREALPAMLAERFGDDDEADGSEPGPTQCHDITLYPEIGLAGGACEGYGLLLDITDPANPRRTDAVADSNFAYWHSATFNNDGTKVLFTDEWGGGGQPKCRATDPPEWGADAIFTLENGEMEFQSYYKLPASQTPEENCVAHNGSLIPIPGRDVMVQAWYQGGISVFDWTDPEHAVEIAFHDRGPIDPDEMVMGGSWSVYWYNGAIVSSEIARGLDVFELVPSAYLSENEIAAATLADQGARFNPQQQFRVTWPAEPVVSRAYLDQLERSKSLPESTVTELSAMLDRAAVRLGNGGRDAGLAGRLESMAAGLDGGRDDVTTSKRKASLAGTLKGIAARLR